MNATTKDRSRRIQEMIEAVNAMPDARARELFHECLQSILALYGDGLERILQLAKNAGSGVTDAFLHDKLIRHLLLIHDLHPQSLETRLRAALDTIRPYLQSHGGNVELLGIENGVARLHLQGTCKTCPSSSATLELAVRQAIEEACPDLAGFEVEDIPANASTKIPHGENALRWTVLDDFPPIAAGQMRALEVQGEPVLVCRLNGSLYAYLNRCAICENTFDAGTLQNDMLACPSGHRFDAHRAGVSSGDSSIHLRPIPLLAANGIIKIAVQPKPSLAAT